MEDLRHIESLLIKSFSGEADEGEKQLIQDWIAESATNQKTFESYLKLWNNSKQLVLSDSIDLEAALKKTKQHIPQFRKKIHWLSYWKQAAAVLLLSVLLSSVYNYMHQISATNKEQAILQEVKAAFGTQTQLQLADGTTVWLNAGSRLSFPVSFNHQSERIVNLDGEGFFKVTKDAKHPFIVHTDQMDIKVLGTSFNVNAYKNDKNITVALEEGKVSLLKQSGGKTKEVLSLKPMEVANYDIENNKIIHTQEKNIERFTAWKDGLIVFSDDPISKVVSRLENWYNVDIQVSDQELLNYHITGTFDDNSLDQVLYFLSLMSPIDYKIVTDNHNQQGTKQTIIISPKKK